MADRPTKARSTLLRDLDFLMDVIVERASNAEYHRAKDALLRLASFPTRKALKAAIASEGAAPRAEGPTDPIDGPVEWLAQAYMDLCNRVDEPFSATLIDEARRAVAAPRAEGLDVVAVILHELELGCDEHEGDDSTYAHGTPHYGQARQLIARLSRPSDEAPR